MRVRLLRLCLLLTLLPVLDGCGARLGRILGTTDPQSSDAAYVTVPPDEYFWLQPPVAGRHSAPLPEMQIPKQGLWVSEGWFVVELQCYSPKNVKLSDAEHPMLDRVQDEQMLYLHGGHRYLLRCSDDRFGEYVLTELDPRVPALPRASR